MKVVVPFTNINECQVQALTIEGLVPLYVRMENDANYWQLMHQLWAEQETFVIVEHDIIPWPGAVEQIYKCESPWCAYPYRLSHDPGYTPAFGCVKFSGLTMAAFPDVWDRLAEGRDFTTKENATHWWGLDGRFSMVMMHGLLIGVPHYHGPPVVHLNMKRFPLDAFVPSPSYVP